MEKEKIVLVCGGRYYTNIRHIHRVLEAAGPTILIEGGATGADNHAGMWAKRKGIAHLKVPAEWDKLGRKAGFARNRRMLDIALAMSGPRARETLTVIAFPGGRGTASMVELAHSEEIENVYVLTEDEGFEPSRAP